MSRRAATIVLIASAAVLLLVLAVGLVVEEGNPRADLVGGTATSRPGGSVTTAPALAPMRTVPLPPPVGSSPTSGAEPGPAGPSGPSGVQPSRLLIADLGVDAEVVPVGLEPDGSMEIPGSTQAGWYEPTGILPGHPAGSAVIAAHVDYQGQRGVFFDLRGIAEGSEVVVLGPDRSERRFKVTERFQVDKDELPAEELFRTGGPPTLTLITCGGAFDRSVRHYEDNIVVRAVPI